jgi:hypothetical protein
MMMTAITTTKKRRGIMPRENEEIRLLIKKSGLSQWMVADKLNIGEATFTRWLRKELSEERRQIVVNAIREVKQEGSQMAQ